MMHLFLNAWAASAGAGLTYVRNVLPQLSSRPGVQTAVALGSALQKEFLGLPRVSFVSLGGSLSARKRFWREQTVLPGIIRQSGAEVLISAGNFALRNSPIPQILLSGNSLYTSPDFFRDLLERGDYRLWLDTKVKGFFARRSVGWANYTVAPSHAFAEDLRKWANGKVVAIHHGFDADLFFADSSPLPLAIQQRLDHAQGAYRLLFVSHYNYYRNFETLLRALPMIRDQLRDRRVKLFLTCRFRSEDNPGSYRVSGAAKLLRELDLEEDVEELGAVPYRSLHHLYRACDLYVTPAYTETFAHPLVEAMASGMPIVASDLAVHKEICGEAAIYFGRWSAEHLAETVIRVSSSQDLAKNLTEQGRMRAREFSWTKHVDQILSLAQNL